MIADVTVMFSLKQYCKDGLPKNSSEMHHDRLVFSLWQYCKDGFTKNRCMREIRRFLCKKLQGWAYKTQQRAINRFLCNKIARMGLLYKTQQTRKMHARCIMIVCFLCHNFARIGLQNTTNTQDVMRLFYGMLLPFVTTSCSPNEDFAKSYKRWNACFRGSFQGCEY